MPTNVTVPAGATSWVSSGLVVPAGWGFSGTAQGSISPTNAVSWGPGNPDGSTAYSYPEGRYNNGSGYFPQTFTYNPALCTPPPNASGTVAPDNYPQCLLMLVSATNPGSAPAPTGASIRGDRTFTISPGDARIPSGSGGTIYLWYNDGPIPSGLEDNGGSFAVSLALIAPIPAAPTLSAVSACIGGQAVLMWGAVANAAGYRVYASGGALIADVGDVLTYAVTGLTTGTAYGYTVTAYDTTGESGHSNTVMVTPCLDPPTGLVWATGGVCEGCQASLTWTASASVGEYLPAVTYSVSREDAGVLASGITGTSYVDATAMVGCTYRYTVSAVDPWGNVSAPTWPVTIAPCCACEWDAAGGAPSGAWSAGGGAPSGAWAEAGAAPAGVWRRRGCLS
jgi:hypothetical protein